MTWHLRVSIDGGQMLWVATGLTEYNDAEAYCKNLYGNNIMIVGQEFK